MSERHDEWIWRAGNGADPEPGSVIPLIPRRTKHQAANDGPRRRSAYWRRSPAEIVRGALIGAAVAMASVSAYYLWSL